MKSLHAWHPHEIKSSSEGMRNFRMPWSLTIIVLIFTFHNFSEAKHNNEHSSAAVVGTVYCDTCFQQDFSKTSHFISGSFRNSYLFIWIYSHFSNLGFFLSLPICCLQYVIWFFLFFSLLVLRSLGCSRMWRNKFKSHFPWGSENKWTWRIQSPSTFLGIQTCQENQAMFSEANQQQRAVLFHSLNGNNFIFTPSEIKNQRNSHFLGWFFHIQASKTANTV